MADEERDVSGKVDGAALKGLFTVALETRNFEISQLVQRNNFFMIFQGVLLAGMIQSSHTKPVVSFLVCLAGFAVSFYQVRMAAGAKFWQEYWEAVLQDIDKELNKHLSIPEARTGKLFHLFHEDDHIYGKMVKDRLSRRGFCLTGFLVMKRYSVSRVPIYVAIALAFVWALLLLCTMRGYPPFSPPSFVVGF
ncbi:hypothetical protein OII53_22175 [Achromobacter ruhlandii]|nr:hypothetical protein [Achromobacter ruhlandii]MCV6798524.1 hypothetical protein [Achromobacter ruhlandii]MCV6802162.1 hypothetical protein [Achromobacter ruhlandii]MCV6810860.1 hypothetical protein [Achromobacter ruhlandii]MCV6821264.1 hypothetical protein [Achromobacter ruhlandii]